ncbi:MAG: hypothetical protein Q8K70_09370 [Bacteroidota bacterium]|nr:hypothetical protein [Bacteroidota bacterium]
MNCWIKTPVLLFTILTVHFNAWAQIETDSVKLKQEEVEEEDFSQYENVNSEGVIKLYCNPKIFDLSPNRFVSVGYDYIFNSKLTTSPYGFYQDGEPNPTPRTSKFSTHGLRVNANIPVISKTRLLWQLGGGYVRSIYQENSSTADSFSNAHNNFTGQLKSYGLTSTNLNTTLFIPTGEKTFAIVQAMGELNGTYNLSNETQKPDFTTIRSSVSALYGKRPHDRFQWAVGLSRTYRAGELNYIPVVMYNYTSANRKWGTEILFPARASYRRKFNSRSILLAGYELEGTSYRIYNTKESVELKPGINPLPPVEKSDFELRRSELRFRLDYQRQLKGFVWMSVQAGVRYDLSYNVDALDGGNDFFRGFFGSQRYLMLNQVGLAPYLNVSINLVSP